MTSFGPQTGLHHGARLSGLGPRALARLQDNALEQVATELRIRALGRRHHRRVADFVACLYALGNAGGLAAEVCVWVEDLY